MAFDITPYIDMKPSEVRKLIREGVIDFPTAGMCRGYAQANLIILPPEYAGDFEEFARRNPFPCPILEIVRGTPETHDMGEGGNICTDIPKYRIYRDGKWDGKELTDVSGYWKEGYVGFLIGCSFSFEEALMREGIEVRHIAQGRNVPMFKTNIMTEPAGPFCGPIGLPASAHCVPFRFSAEERRKKRALRIAEKLLVRLLTQCSHIRRWVAGALDEVISIGFLIYA